MSMAHYCEVCGVELLSFFKKGDSLRLLDELQITKCKECDPKSWDRYDNYSITFQRHYMNQSKDIQWSKFHE